MIFLNSHHLQKFIPHPPTLLWTSIHATFTFSTKAWQPSADVTKTSQKSSLIDWLIGWSLRRLGNIFQHVTGQKSSTGSKGLIYCQFKTVFVIIFSYILKQDNKIDDFWLLFVIFNASIVFFTFFVTSQVKCRTGSPTFRERNDSGFVAHLKQSINAKFIQKRLSVVTHVYKINHTGQPMWNIRISYFFYQQASKSVRRHNVVKYCWSAHALLNRIARCETSNSKRRYYCVPWYIQIWQLLF